MCLFNADHDDSETCTSSTDKLVFDNFKSSSAVVECHECNRAYHQQCVLLSAEAREKFKCLLCEKPRQGKCLVCSQSKGVLIEVSNDKDVSVHFLCAYLSSNFFVASWRPVEVSLTNCESKSLYKNTDQAVSCCACSSAVAANDSYFVCDCAKRLHVFCGLYCQAVCAQDEDMSEHNSECLPVLKLDCFKPVPKTNHLDNRLTEKLLKKVVEARSLPTGSLGSLIEDFKKSWKASVVSTHFEFEMRCFGCSPDQSRICCYQSKGGLITMCSICNNWSHSSAECMDKFEADVDKLRESNSDGLRTLKRSAVVNKRARTGGPRQDDSVFVCKTCAHLCVCLLADHSWNETVRVKPRNLSTSLFILSHVLEAKGIEKKALIDRFRSAALLKLDTCLLEMEIDRLLKAGQERLVFRGVVQRVWEYIQADNVDAAEFNEIQLEFESKSACMSDSNCELKYLQSVMQVLGFQASLSRFTFESVESALLDYLKCSQKVPRDDRVKGISTYIDQHFVSRLAATRQYVADQSECSTLQLVEFGSRLGQASGTTADDIMRFLQLKLNSEAAAAYAHRTGNNLLLCFMRNLTIDSDLELFLLEFDSRQALPFQSLQKAFERLLSMRVWLDQFKQKIRSFVEFYCEAVSLVRSRDGLFERMDCLNFEYRHVEARNNFRRLTDKLVLVSEVEESLRQSAVIHRNEELAELLSRSLKGDAELMGLLENRQALNTHTLLKSVFSLVASQKVAVSGAVRESVEVQLFQHWTEAMGEQLTIEEFERRESEAAGRCGSLSFFEAFRSLNRERRALAHRIEDFSKDHGQGFFDRTVFQRFDELRAEANRLNLSHFFVDSWAQNLEFYNEFMLGRLNSFCVENDPPDLDKFMTQTQRVNALSVENLAQILSLRIDRFYSQELLDCYEGAQQAYVEHMCALVCQGQRKPDLVFLRDYCSGSKRFDYQDKVSSDSLHFERNAVLMEELRKQYGQFECDFVEAWQCLKQPLADFEHCLSLIHKAVAHLDRIEVNQTVVSQKLMVMSVFEIVLSVLRLMEGQSRTMSGRGRAAEERGGGEAVRGGSDGDSEAGRQGESEGGWRCKEVAKLESLFGLFLRNVVDWRKFKNHHIVKVVERFLKSMNKYVQTKTAEGVVNQQLTRLSFLNKHLRVREDRLEELLGELRKYEVVFGDKCGLYESRLGQSREVGKQMSGLMEGLSRLSLDAVLVEPHIDAVYQLMESYHQTGLTSATTAKTVDVFEALMLLHQNNGLQFENVKGLLSQLEVALAGSHETVLGQSVRDKAQLMVRTKKAVGEMQREMASKTQFQSNLSELKSFMSTPGLVTCFDYPDFESFVNDVQCFDAQHFDLACYLDRMSRADQPRMVWFRRRNLDIEAAKSKVEFVNEHFDGSAKAMGADQKAELYCTVSHLTQSISDMYSVKVRMIYAEVKAKRAEFEYQLTEVGEQLRAGLSARQRVESAPEQRILDPMVLNDAFNSEVVEDLESVLLGVKVATLRMVQCLQSLPNSHSFSALKSLVSRFSLNELFDGLDLKVNKPQKVEFANGYKCCLAKLLAVAASVTNETPEECLADKGASQWVRVFKEERERHKRANLTPVNLLAELAPAVFAEVAQFVDTKETKFVKSMAKQRAEGFLERIGYYKRYLGPARVAKLTSLVQRFDNFEALSHKVSSMFGEVLVLVNSWYRKASSDHNDCPFKFKLQQIKSELLRSDSMLEESDDQRGPTVECRIQPVESAFAKLDIADTFDQLCKFVRKSIRKNEDFQALSNEGFDSRAFLSRFEDSLTKKPHSPAAPPSSSNPDHSLPPSKYLSLVDPKSDDRSPRKTDGPKQPKPRVPPSTQPTVVPIDQLFLFAAFTVQVDHRLVDHLMVVRDERSEFNFTSMAVLRLNFKIIKGVTFEEIEKTVLRGLGFRERKKKTDLMFGVVVFRKRDVTHLETVLSGVSFGQQVWTVPGQKVEVVCTIGRFDSLKERLCVPFAALLKVLKKHDDLAFFFLALEQRKRGRPSIDPKVNDPFFSQFSQQSLDDFIIGQ